MPTRRFVPNGENVRRINRSMPTEVNPNSNEHWSGLTKEERDYNSYRRLPKSIAPLPKYLVSRRSMDGRVQKKMTHQQRYNALRAAFNVP